MRLVIKTFVNAPMALKFPAIVVLAYVILAIFAPAFAPYSETEIVGGHFDPWSKSHPLGTDNIGRDALSRLIYGGRNTIGIAVATATASFTIGISLGFFVAIAGGWIDSLISRLVDALMAVPALIFALMLLTVFGTSIPVLVAVIALLDSTRVFRLSRALAMNIVVMDYFEAAQLRREGLWWMIRREILPNAVAPLVAEFGIRFSYVFLFISILSFLGIGIQPPMADWGSMVRDNANLITFGDVTPLIPALAIAILTVSVNLIADWFIRRASGLKDDQVH
jgi:peptide/nickel transport system permease protein